MTNRLTLRAMKQISSVALVFVGWAGTAWGEDAPELRAQYARAFDLYGGKKYDESRQILAEIWPKLKTHDVATLYGQVEMKQGNFAAAAQFFSVALAKLPPTVSARQSETLRQWLADVKKHVATYEVTANVAGAVLSVDGVDYGVTPLEIPVFVGAGPHIVLLSLDGFRGGDARLSSVEGGTEKLELKMIPLEKPAAASASTLPDPPPQVSVVPMQPSLVPPQDRGVGGSDANYWVLVGGGALAVSGLATALVFHSMANSEYDKAAALEAKAGQSGCYGSLATTGDCVNQSEFVKDGDRNRIISQVAWGVGGVALVATTAYWLWPRKGGPNTGSSHPTVMSSVSPNGTWLGIGGRY